MKLRKILAGAMALAMTFSYSVAAAAPAPASITGTTTVTNPVYSVLLPTAATMALQLNPMSVGSPDVAGLKDRVSSGVGIIANRSNVPIEVTAQFGLRVPTSNAPTMVGTATAVTDVTDQTTKVAFLQLQLATGVDNSKILNNTAVTAISSDAISVTPATATAVTTITNVMTGTGAAAVSGHIFKAILKASEYNTANTALSAANAPSIADSVTGFKIGGEITKYAAWAATDLGVNAVFTVAGRNIEDYENAVANLGVTVATGTVRWFTVTP